MEAHSQFLKAIVPNKHYYAEASFDLEKQKVFQDSWYYVGLSDDLSAHQDFITHEIGGKSVVVQNFKGELKAFHNVCTHRFNIIKSDKRGNGPLACPYHNWNYNKDGIPFGIPLKREFQGLDKDSLQELCLPQFNLEICGKFVFVNVSNSAPPLKDFLGETWAVLEEISGMVGRKVEYHEIPNKANWKILIENTLEGYHIASVHPTTFYKQGFNLKSAVDFDIQGDHSSMLLHLDPKAEENKKRERFHKLIKDRPFQPKGFFHQLVFPNLSIGSLFGVTVYIGTIQAVSATESIFAYDLYETNLGEGQLLDEAISEVVRYSSIEFTRTTLAEDKEICEHVQEGMSQTANEKGVLNSSEIRIWEFQKAYMKAIETAMATNNRQA
ncbi:aromatic ring-hydroxylating dioxygenase subunit alpha [Marinilongibacter aquaticus]|uniref:aromatic ring-hydroxylating oxygenase subunit alpha n=1 Tax=Marinilongibacter aquaticus TaxID=2975157 RepID=UPI0021BDD0E1|nr:aromatic ring-hydroxylating dioxygenase subunit alpha [Marinilongibacter aquaticus]UBM57668.1 aromatic ring-hydroxylating dioxygenase subunit alpha [Marinilongibacter aquaticus]